MRFGESTGRIEEIKMQFRDLGAQYHALKNEIDEEIRKVLESSCFILGEPVQELEERLAEYAGRKHCIGVANGTEALQLSLMALDVGPGDAVFTSDFTYFASAGCAAIIGATPVLVDIDLETFNMSPEALEGQIRKVLREGKLKPKAIIPVDLFGLPANHPEIQRIAEKYGLRIVEDAAQGFGGQIGDRMACSFGELSATSFFPAKPLGCYGDGGAVFTDDDALDARLRSLRASGKSPTDKYDNREVGMNSRLDTLQAAILLPKLRAFQEYEVTDINRVADRYTQELKDYVDTPLVPEGYRSSWAQYTILLENREQRDRVSREMKAKGIPTMVYYPRGLHQQEAFRNMKLSDSDYPNTLEATQRVLSLPMHPYLTIEDQDLVIRELLEVL